MKPMRLAVICFFGIGLGLFLCPSSSHSKCLLQQEEPLAISENGRFLEVLLTDSFCTFQIRKLVDLETGKVLEQVESEPLPGCHLEQYEFETSPFRKSKHLLGQRLLEWEVFFSALEPLSVRRLDKKTIEFQCKEGLSQQFFLDSLFDPRKEILVEIKLAQKHSAYLFFNVVQFECGGFDKSRLIKLPCNIGVAGR